MFGLIKGLLFLVAGGAAIYVARQILKRIDSLSDSINKAKEYISSIPKRISDATAEAKESLVEQSKQTSRERRGDTVFGSGLEAKAKRNADAAREDRKKNQAAIPADTRKQTLQKQIATAKENNAAGIFDNGLFVPIEDLQKELAAL